MEHDYPLFISLLTGRDDLKYQQKFLKVFHMAHRNFCKDLPVRILKYLSILS